MVRGPRATLRPMTTRHSARFYGFVGWLGNTRLVTRFHPIAYRATGGRWITGSTLGILHIVLTTTGRRTGRRREAPLFAFRDGDRFVVVASKNGSDAEPGWIWNLRANPVAGVRFGRDVIDVRAHEARGEERARLWRTVAAGFPGYELYQQQTARRIPIVVLVPISEEAG